MHVFPYIYISDCFHVIMHHLHEWRTYCMIIINNSIGMLQEPDFCEINCSGRMP